MDAYEGGFIYYIGFALVTNNSTVIKLVMTNATVSFSFNPNTCIAHLFGSVYRTVA